MPRPSHGLLGLLMSALVLLAGCATPLPSIDREAAASEAILGSHATTLGRTVEASTPQGAHSGFRLMPLGAFSFDTRLQLARRAEASLDVQYYHLENDDAGRALLRALRDAADRGVRVRLLIDDLYTGGSDELFLAFAAHRNVQVRLFNPFCCARESGQGTRFAASIGDWGRVNHRMHNKLFIADGTAAVIGGRNIANEYFLRKQDGNFIDLDAFVVGRVVEPLAALFDRYWNSDPAYPLESVARTALTPAQLRDWFERVTGAGATEPPPALPSTDILGYGPLRDELDDGRLGLIWGYAYVFADHPDKPFDGEVGGELLETSVTYNVFEADQAGRDRGAGLVALLRSRAAWHGDAARTARTRRQDHRADQLARRHRRTAGVPGLQPLPRRHAAHGGRPVRTEQFAGQAQQANVPLRREPGSPARQAGGDRPPDLVHRLDEPRSTFGDHQHRTRRD